MKRVLAASESAAAYAIVVDANDDRAREFYATTGPPVLPARTDPQFADVPRQDDVPELQLSLS
ncbi:MAG: hypothetical protein E6J61_15835 [Deltaproteobacteria bacterium]|nr:MAG: hypothetical protein E6J61_15835 [Deltaproteobacteria bacterium]